ncbi:hypothetical protein [Limnoraphis robusta]|uniref:Uncharacterized protein n=1 Tax=Limnoraphis robusta CCNP1315 TaxID=3110306 RepID=A0ABU5U7M4_9CYAN|nr:hypothetical protein [Limnoraphis robusta]MEA5499529.1 hypothetical protein [Limnoraphis robusta BA-68 BA1]MEA5523174.1 hypothetical protein [Limnoraphis robusta CCNP1315]MEA5544741.1 hypothetical protein [Limnoraphis robusta CCNP1324]
MKTTANSRSLPSFDFVSKSHNFERKLAKILVRLTQAILRFLVGSSEPKIWQTQRRDQTLIWHVYDPQTQRSKEFFSEEELRIWLEQRYYSRSQETGDRRQN